MSPLLNRARKCTVLSSPFDQTKKEERIFFHVTYTSYHNIGFPGQFAKNK